MNGTATLELNGVPIAGVSDIQWSEAPSTKAPVHIGASLGLQSVEVVVEWSANRRHLHRRLHRLLNRALSDRRAKRHRRIVKAKTRCLATRMFRDWQKQEGRRNGHFSHAEVVRMLMQFARSKS